MKRYLGEALLATALLHTGVGIVLYWTVLVEIGRNGIFNTVPDFGDRAAAYWFLMCGFAIACIGVAAKSNQGDPTRVSRSFAVALILFGMIAVVMMPLSGMWILILIGGAILKR